MSNPVSLVVRTGGRENGFTGENRGSAAMNRIIHSFGVGLLLLSFGFVLLVSFGGWVEHLMSWNLGGWRLLKPDDNIHTLVQDPPNGIGLREEPVLKVEGDISRVEQVLMTGSPDISVYFDADGKVISAQLGVSSVLRHLSLWELNLILVLVITSLFLIFGRGNYLRLKSRLLGLFLMSFTLCYVSALLRFDYPLNIWGIAVGLSLILIAIVLSISVLTTWLGRRSSDIETIKASLKGKNL